MLCAVALVFYSCESNNSTNDNKPQITTTKWEPQTIELVKIVSLYTADYPRTKGCGKDYLELSSNGTATFFHYDGAECAVTKYEQAFERTENQVKLNMMGYEIEGTITKETATEMEIQSEITEYIPYIKQMLSQYADYLDVLEGATVKLTLSKK